MLLAAPPPLRPGRLACLSSGAATGKGRPRQKEPRLEKRFFTACCPGSRTGGWPACLPLPGLLGVPAGTGQPSWGLGGRDWRGSGRAVRRAACGAWADGRIKVAQVFRDPRAGERPTQMPAEGGRGLGQDETSRLWLRSPPSQYLTQKLRLAVTCASGLCQDRHWDPRVGGPAGSLPTLDLGRRRLLNNESGVGDPGGRRGVQAHCHVARDRPVAHGASLPEQEGKEALPIALEHPREAGRVFLVGFSHLASLRPSRYEAVAMCSEVTGPGSPGLRDCLSWAQCGGSDSASRASSGLTEGPAPGSVSLG